MQPRPAKVAWSFAPNIIEYAICMHSGSVTPSTATSSTGVSSDVENRRQPDGEGKHDHGAAVDEDEVLVAPYHSEHAARDDAAADHEYHQLTPSQPADAARVAVDHDWAGRRQRDRALAPAQLHERADHQDEGLQPAHAEQQPRRRAQAQEGRRAFMTSLRPEGPGALRSGMSKWAAGRVMERSRPRCARVALRHRVWEVRGSSMTALYDRQRGGAAAPPPPPTVAALTAEGGWTSSYTASQWLDTPALEVGLGSALLLCCVVCCSLQFYTWRVRRKKLEEQPLLAAPSPPTDWEPRRRRRADRHTRARIRPAVVAAPLRRPARRRPLPRVRRGGPVRRAPAVRPRRALPQLLRLRLHVPAMQSAHHRRRAAAPARAPKPSKDLAHGPSSA